MPQVQEEEVADEIAVDLVEVKVVRDGGDVEVFWLLFGRVVVRGDAPVPDLVGDRVDKLYGGPKTEPQDVDKVGLGQLEQRRSVDVVGAKFLEVGRGEE